MAKTELKTDAANLALRAAAIVGVIYGISFLLLRDQLSADAVLHVSAERRSRCANQLGMGALGWRVCFWYAIGPWLASEGWVKEQPFISSRGSLCSVPASRSSIPVVSREYADAAWFIWTPIVILAVLAPTMWWLATKD